MVKRVLLTGATGFIGRHCLTSFLSHGYDIHAVSSRIVQNSNANITWHQANLLNSREIGDLVTRVKPTHLLHLGWYLVPGNYSAARENLLWIQASLELLRKFHEVSGVRVVMAGSCMEYDWKYGYCSEDTTPRVPNTFYGTCKDVLQSLLCAYSGETGLSSAWGRIFFLYGPHEHPARLVSSVIRSLLRNEPALCSHGKQIRDYLYVQDIADALVALLESNVQGPVNIGSGQPIALRDIIYRIGRKLNRDEMIRLGAIAANPNDSSLVVADVGRLATEVGWRPRYDWDNGLERTIHWWRNQLNTGGAGEE